MFSSRSRALLNKALTLHCQGTLGGVGEGEEGNGCNVVLTHTSSTAGKERDAALGCFRYCRKHIPTASIITLTVESRTTGCIGVSYGSVKH